MNWQIAIIVSSLSLEPFSARVKAGALGSRGSGDHFMECVSVICLTGRWPKSRRLVNLAMGHLKKLRRIVFRQLANKV